MKIIVHLEWSDWPIKDDDLLAINHDLSAFTKRYIFRLSPFPQIANDTVWLKRQRERKAKNANKQTNK